MPFNCQNGPIESKGHFYNERRYCFYMGVFLKKAPSIFEPTIFLRLVALRAQESYH